MNAPSPQFGALTTNTRTRPLGGRSTPRTKLFGLRFDKCDNRLENPQLHHYSRHTKSYAGGSLTDRRKRETVTVSFHYLVRQPDEDGDAIPFSEDEFAALADALKSVGEVDLNDDKIKDRVRLKRLVPIEDVSTSGTRLIFGLYRAAYWGHAYENTAVGKIPADSISLRPFYFMLYLSKKGKIFVGVQYLGQFGSYEGLKNTLIRHFHKEKEIVAHSFRNDAAYFENVEPSEVQVRIARKPEDISKKNAFTDGALVTFKKQNRNDEFGAEVKRRLLPALGTNISAAKRAASEIINDSGLLDVKDEDIVDCTVIGKVDGKRKTIYMISPGMFATPFFIKPTFNDDGHPNAAPTFEQMQKVLEDRVISISKE